MDKNEVSMMRKLELQVLNEIFEVQLKSFLFDGKPLITQDELANHIVENFGKYIKPDEFNMLLIEQVGTADNNELNQLAVRALSQICSYNVIRTIHGTLTHPYFTKDNPFNILTNPMHFMIHKYLTEEMGLNIELNNAN